MIAGKIYFLRRADGLIKVGYTGNLKRRIGQLSKSHGHLEVIKVVNGDRQREKRLHAALAQFNEFGEWFRDCADLRSLIDSVASGSTVELASSDAGKRWAQGEAAMMEDARDTIARIILSRRKWAGLSNDQAIKAVSADYGIREWLIKNIHCGRASTVSAYAMQVLRAALYDELLKYRDTLLQWAKDAENAA